MDAIRPRPEIAADLTFARPRDERALPDRQSTGNDGAVGLAIAALLVVFLAFGAAADLTRQAEAIEAPGTKAEIDLPAAAPSRMSGEI